ncbi:segregation/condensation protein A [Candidatus Nitronereus thalassa]|uniref:Segregation and condensation protein A n=1 Tax=Candidatus Nitronereus thalassa TaxID=3020898 RepID=A0ABU3K6R6_9BACT|nr:segregation/condensation protein A [Candidatus Nitronereus thalassa]MDT7042062.1 segregation/condensation protein A [Candidatus Nitronereus thalassa]
MEQMEIPYEVKLDAFTGPLDLLLHLIRKHEIDIYDIPVSLITQQYLEYLQLMKELNLSFAGEFLVMAATLIQIKSRMLLPQEAETPMEEEEGEDPRSELVRRLVEYQQFKDVAGELSDREKFWRDMFQREPMDVPKIREVLMDDVSMFDLLGALQEVLTRTEAQVVVDITPDTLTVQDRINGIIERLEDNPTITFTSLFDNATTRLVVIVTFLALLELVRMKLVKIFQGDLFGAIRISRTFLAEVDGNKTDGPGESDGLDSLNHGGNNGNGYH